MVNKIIQWFKNLNRPVATKCIGAIQAKDIQQKLKKNPYWNGPSKKHRPNQRTYNYQELFDVVNGRRVKNWLQVYEADDIEGNEYVPIFKKRKQIKREV